MYLCQFIWDLSKVSLKFQIRVFSTEMKENLTMKQKPFVLWSIKCSREVLVVFQVSRNKIKHDFTNNLPLSV